MLGDHLPALFHPFANTLPKLLGALANGLAAFLAEVFSQAYTLFRLLAGQLLEFFKILLGLLADLLQPALPAFSLLNDLGLQYPSNLAVNLAGRLTGLLSQIEELLGAGRSAGGVAGADLVDQGMQFFGMLLLDGQHFLEQAARRRIVGTEVIDYFLVALDGDAFGHQVFLDHFDDGFALDIFGMAALGQRGR